MTIRFDHFAFPAYARVYATSYPRIAMKHEYGHQVSVFNMLNGDLEAQFEFPELASMLWRGSELYLIPKQGPIGKWRPGGDFMRYTDPIFGNFDQARDKAMFEDYQLVIATKSSDPDSQAIALYGTMERLLGEIPGDPHKIDYAGNGQFMTYTDNGAQLWRKSDAQDWQIVYTLERDQVGGMPYVIDYSDYGDSVIVGVKLDRKLEGSADRILVYEIDPDKGERKELTTLKAVYLSERKYELVAFYPINQSRKLVIKATDSTITISDGGYRQWTIIDDRIVSDLSVQGNLLVWISGQRVSAVNLLEVIHETRPGEFIYTEQALYSELRSLDERIQVANGDMWQIGQQIATIEDRVNEEVDRVNKRVDRVNKRVEFINKRAERVNKEVELVTKRVELVNERVSEEVELVYDRIDGVKADLDGVDKRLENEQARIDDLESRVNQLEQELEKALLTIKKLEAKLNTQA